MDKIKDGEEFAEIEILQQQKEELNNEFLKNYTPIQIVATAENGKGEVKETIVLPNSLFNKLQEKAREQSKNPEELIKEVIRQEIEHQGTGPASNYENINIKVADNINDIQTLEAELYSPEAAEIYNLPFGPYMYVLLEAVGHIGTGRQIYPNLTQNGTKKNNRNIRVNIEPYSENGFTLTHRNKKARTSITIINKELFKSTSTIKLFVFLLAKAAQQNFNPVIYFSLEELVNIGMYSNINNARAGFKNHILSIQSIQIAGEMKKYADKKNKGSIKQQGGVLFYNYQLDQNGAKVWINPAFNIEYLAGYYAIVPSWAFSLSDRGFNLLIYVLMLARTNRKKHFNIGFEQIRERLALPTKQEYDDINREIKEENKTLPPDQQKPLKKFKPQQYIKTPIKKTIEEIIDAIALNKCDFLEVAPHYEDKAESIDKWLSSGYMEVTTKGDLSKQITKHLTNQRAIVEKNAERKAAIIEANKNQ